MKKFIWLTVFMAFALTSAFGHTSKTNLKAEKAAAMLVKFNKAIAALDERDFVIVVDSYRSNYNGATYFTMDRTNFFSYEKQFAYVQGAIFFGEVYPDNHKLEVSDFSKVIDAKGNVTVKMFVRGTLAKARVEIFLKNGDNTADVIYTMRGCALRYTGEVVPTSESNYFKRVNKV